MISKSSEILTNHIEEVTDEKDIPFSIGTLGTRCMDNTPLTAIPFMRYYNLTTGEGYHIINFEPNKVKSDAYTYRADCLRDCISPEL